MSALPAIAEQIERLRTAGSELDALRDRTERGGPWPLSEDFGTAPESHWGPPETLAHLEEMVPFWHGEIERVLAGPPGPVPFGRTADDTVRLAIIERDRTLPLRELFARIDASLARLTNRLGSLSRNEAERIGVHPRLGDMTVDRMVERFLTGHLEEHVEQLRSVLDEAGLPDHAPG